MYEMLDLVRDEISIIRQMACRLKVDIVSLEPETEESRNSLVKAWETLDLIDCLSVRVDNRISDAIGESDD